MKPLLRLLLRFHLRRARWLWAALAAVTLLLGGGIARVERRLDLMSLLPTEHPVVKASLEAGVGQQEILWLAAEGSADTLEAREAWMEALVGRLMAQGTMPENGIDPQGRLSRPWPVCGAKGPSLWPALLAASGLVEGDPDVTRLVTRQAYGLAPALIGDRLAVLGDATQLRQRFRDTAKALGSPDPVKARLAQLDPLNLRELMPAQQESLARAKQSAKAFPLKLHGPCLATPDGRFVLLPLVLDFPSGDSGATARVLTWLGQGAQGALPAKARLGDVERALAARPDRAFALQATGAHAIALWEAQRLGHEVALSLILSFILIGFVYWGGFRTLAGYGFVVAPLLLGMVWTLGSVGWMLGRLNLMAAAFGAVLLGVGDDVGILLFSRYRDERQQGRSKALALRAALLGTGPGVVAGVLATSLAFLACVVAPFPGFRDLGLTAGVGLLACLAASFLLLPPLLLVFDKGRGPFAPRADFAVEVRPRRPRWKPLLASAAVLLCLLGAFRVRWEEDLRRFRQNGNPALALQETLGKTLGAGLQPWALQFPLDDAASLAHRWNTVAEALSKEGLPLPRWQSLAPELRQKLGGEAWYQEARSLAAQEGLDEEALGGALASLQRAVNEPLEGPRALRDLMAASARSPRPDAPLSVPLRLSERAQDRVETVAEPVGVRAVGTRPLFQAIKSVARNALRQVVLLALAAVVGVVAFFGRRLRFVALALAPMIASQIGVFGVLGWSGEPLTFLSLVAIPIALGVSVDTALNLLHRSRRDAHAAPKVARVNAVCALTTLAGFGGLVFSGYRGLRGLGLAALGGTALALLVTQWLLPWLLERWPVGEEPNAKLPEA